MVKNCCFKYVLVSSSPSAAIRCFGDASDQAVTLSITTFLVGNMRSDAFDMKWGDALSPASTEIFVMDTVTTRTILPTRIYIEIEKPRGEDMKPILE